MSERRGDDSRPSASAHSQRATLRDVPAAKYREGSVGTVAPRGLRGPSLQPGEGAPERVIPEEVELAVLRDAETLDGPNVARTAAGKRRLLEARPPSPTPVSVEVPRVRSIPPTHSEYVSTPPTPSARSIQSGTLMSIGSVDPRAPTELSLPSPRPMSVSERAAYFGPEAVVDRNPAHSARGVPSVIDRNPARDVTERTGPPSSEPMPRSSARDIPAGTGASSSSRPSLKSDSVAPPAQNFARLPHSYSPLSTSAMKPARPSPMRPPRPDPKPPRSETGVSAPPMTSSAAGEREKFQIHADLDAVPHHVQDDGFDLRSVSTQREPLASRKAQSSAEWTPRVPVALISETEHANSSRSSSTAVTLLVDRGRASAPPSIDPLPPPRPAVPLSWVLGAAVFAVVLALIVAFALRPSAPPQAVAPLDGRASAAVPPSTAQAAPPESPPPLPPPGTKRTGPASRSSSGSSKSPAHPAGGPATSATVAAPASSDANPKGHQSIY